MKQLKISKLIFSAIIIMALSIDLKGQTSSSSGVIADKKVSLKITKGKIDKTEMAYRIPFGEAKKASIKLTAIEGPRVIPTSANKSRKMPALSLKIRLRKKP